MWLGPCGGFEPQAPCVATDTMQTGPSPAPWLPMVVAQIIGPPWRLGCVSACVFDARLMRRATRDLRYWSARRATAQLVETEPEGRVRFGGTVTLERADGRTRTWRITGEDEADPAAGSVSHVSPLAVALMGKQVGDEAVVAGQAVEVIAVD